MGTQQVREAFASIQCKKARKQSTGQSESSSLSKRSPEDQNNPLKQRLKDTIDE